MCLISKSCSESTERKSCPRERKGWLSDFLKNQMNHILCGRETEVCSHVWVFRPSPDHFDHTEALGHFAVPCQRHLCFHIPLNLARISHLFFWQLHGIFSHLENALMFVICTVNKSKKADPLQSSAIWSSVKMLMESTTQRTKAET
jgi:hypothetical protein